MNSTEPFPPTVKDGERTGNGLACVASVSVWFRSEERPRNGIFGFGRPRNGTEAIFRAVFDSCSSFFAPKPHGNACYTRSTDEQPVYLG